jgi:hypothetical protein
MSIITEQRSGGSEYVWEGGGASGVTEQEASRVGNEAGAVWESKR